MSSLQQDAMARVKEMELEMQVATIGDETHRLTSHAGSEGGGAEQKKKKGIRQEI